jgi:pseudouridine synthase
MHPRYEHSKEYIVETFGSIDDNQLEAMRRWLFILWKMTNQAAIKRISSWTFSIILTEWRNRQIRRMVEKVWSRVKKLKRIRIENIHLWDLKPWEYIQLTKKERQELFSRIWLKNI